MISPISNGLRATIETYVFMVSISLRITKCSVTHNKVMNIQNISDYMLKSSKCGPHASKMKSWILYRLRSTQKYPHFEDFFIDQRWLKFRIFYHVSRAALKHGIRNLERETESRKRKQKRKRNTESNINDRKLKNFTLHNLVQSKENLS